MCNESVSNISKSTILNIMEQTYKSWQSESLPVGKWAHHWEMLVCCHDGRIHASCLVPENQISQRKLVGISFKAFLFSEVTET